MDKEAKIRAYSKMLREEAERLIEAPFGVTVDLNSFDKILESFIDVALEGYKPRPITGAEILRRHTRPDND
jgi:hypothetical protein